MNLLNIKTEVTQLNAVGAPPMTKMFVMVEVPNDIVVSVRLSDKLVKQIEEEAFAAAKRKLYLVVNSKH